MSLKVQLPKDIKFIRYYSIYLNIFLIAPWYDFSKNTMYNPYLAKFYGTCLILIKLLLILWASRDQEILQLFSQELFITEKFIVIFLVTNLALIYIYSVINSAFLDSNRWTRLFDNLYWVDKTLRNNDAKEIYLPKRCLYEFMIKHVIFVGILAYELYVWGIFMNMPLYKIFWLTGYEDMYFEFLLVMFMAALVRSFEARYKILNNELLQVCLSTQKFKKEVKRIMQIYRVLGQNIQIFNEVFGYAIVLMLFHHGTACVSCLNFIIVYIIIGIQELPLFHHMLVANLSILILMLINCVTLLSSISSTTAEAKKFLNLCYRIREEFLDDTVHLLVQALEKLIDHSKYFLQEFHTNGCFTLNKGIIFSLIANISTYLIITIQLNESQYKNMNVSAQNCS
ncbi:gustatory receptor 107 [Tribolium castaneum]|uniref:Gustatory receptor n=1 Tax=Tribolium castaneum TaxID=7070 RepID=D6WRP4_TRICA|nr:gustatory receptor 107 [Tribolium castaneum]